MTRVLIINTAHTTFNGITSVIMNYVRTTHKTVQYDFVLCGNTEQSFEDELKKLGKSVFHPPYPRNKKPLKYVAWLKKIIKENGYDAVHVHGNSGTMYFDIHAAKAAGAPIRIAHSHSTSSKHMLVHKILKPFLNCELTHAIACSDVAGKWLFNRKYIVLPNGIFLDKFAFSQETRSCYRKQFGIEDNIVVGHIGYMDVEKNHMFLLKVFKRLIERENNVRLMLIGDGRLRSEIEQYISQNDLSEHVFLLGKRSDVNNLYQCMDVFVLPSLFEGLPVTLIEAQTAGLPCLVSNAVSKEANILHDMIFLDINERDIDAWCDEILRACKNKTDRLQKIEEMKKTVYNIDQCMEKVLSIYKIE